MYSLYRSFVSGLLLALLSISFGVQPALAANCKKNPRKVKIFVENLSALRLQVAVQKKGKKKIKILGTLDEFSENTFKFRPKKKGGKYKILATPIDQDDVPFALLENVKVKRIGVKPLDERCKKKYGREVKRLAYTKTLPAVSGCFLVPGPWVWFNGVAEFFLDGTAVNEGIVTTQAEGEDPVEEKTTLTGTWSCTDPNTGEVTVNWENDLFIDTLYVTEFDPTKVLLQGLNGQAEQVTAHKL